MFDSDGTFKTQFLNIGTPTALCMTAPNQVLYIAHPATLTAWEDAAIYVDLTGRSSVFGRRQAGKQFGLVN